jgi:hypothetical protein
MGVVLVAAGIPGYLYWNWKNKKKDPATSKIA